MNKITVPNEKKEEALLWLCGIPNYNWRWISSYPNFTIELMSDLDAVAFKLKFSNG